MIQALIRVLIAPPPLLTGVLLNLLVLGVTPAFGHLMTLDCPALEQKKVAKMDNGQLLSNGMYAEAYDSDGDGVVDIVTLSHMVGDKHDTHPVFYMVDLDKDGQPDQVFIDKVGKGKCSDIVLYEDLTIPHDKGVMTKWSEDAIDQGREI